MISSVGQNEPKKATKESWVLSSILIILLAIIVLLIVWLASGQSAPERAGRRYLPAPPIVTDRFVFPSGKTPYPSARTTLIGKGKVPGGD